MSALTSAPVDLEYANHLLFDDAAAIVDRGIGLLIWASDAWLAAQPELEPGVAIETVVERLPAAAKGLCVEPSSRLSDVAPADESGHWTVQTRSIGGQRIALRLTDQREHGRAMARQLHDRESLLFTSRVLSVGEMATTLAHELNQPIAAAASLLRGLQARLSRRSQGIRPDELKALGKSLDQLMFASQVITRIREFTQSHRPRPQSLDMGGLIRQSAELLDWDVQRAGVGLSLSGVQDPSFVNGDEVMLQQVLINLVRNAMDALRDDPPADPRIAVQLLSTEEQVEVRVSDNGCGLDDEAAARLFVPFASSKPTGMGLGLSICRSFIELHQGRLWFSRNPDRGTTFHIALPRTEPTEPNASMQEES